MSTHRAYLGELRQRAQRLQRDHDRDNALAAAAERARITREMHDSVAYHLTVIVALSDGALAAVQYAPHEAADAIRDVSSTARQALAEARRLFGVLRADAGPESRQPLPVLADLDDLLGRGERGCPAERHRHRRVGGGRRRRHRRYPGHRRGRGRPDRDARSPTNRG
ncbi:MAG TPA: histidine kinase dimerization/phosphoacceptor domain-containing protein [Streptosporangiaceae bacterium]|jgi:hypothetical protein